MKKLLLLVFIIGCGQGPQGLPGPAGSDLNPITIVHFCPGSTIYPTTFIEVALCVDNELWAVYSSNGGFLTLVPQGNYTSDGINSICNFTVGPNCTVTNY